MIDDHDYDVKMRAMQRFFEEGDKVKVTLRYRGREMAHQEIGTKLLDKVKSDVAESPRSNRTRVSRAVRS
jgi:translation initiation factor IF-3